MPDDPATPTARPCTVAPSTVPDSSAISARPAGTVADRGEPTGVAPSPRIWPSIAAAACSNVTLSKNATTITPVSVSLPNTSLPSLMPCFQPAGVLTSHPLYWSDTGAPVAGLAANAGTVFAVGASLGGGAGGRPGCGAPSPWAA